MELKEGIVPAVASSLKNKVIPKGMASSARSVSDLPPLNCQGAQNVRQVLQYVF